MKGQKLMPSSIRKRKLSKKTSKSSLKRLFLAVKHIYKNYNNTDNIGAALTEALRQAINQELRTLEARPHDRVNFSMTAHGFTQAFQSINVEVREFLERSLRLDTLLQSLADKLIKR